MKTAVSAKAEVEFEIIWESSLARHRERFLAPSVNFRRDILHERLAAPLAAARPGDEIVVCFGPGEALPSRDEGNVIALRSSRIRPPAGSRGEKMRVGRFYPRGLLSAAGGGFFPQDVRPFRVTGNEDGWITADCNHPLAGRTMRLTARVREAWQRDTERGARCIDWIEEATGGGPGMEGRWGDAPTDFGPSGPLPRGDEGEDRIFYAGPRMTAHVDDRASAFLGEEYLRRLGGAREILDLMSSLHSHLAAAPGQRVTGLGMNGEEMAVNPLLDSAVVHDLNADPCLPFPGDSFDAVLCSLSWEYLTRPGEVALEAARVLRPGGLLLVGLSNRWFPPKVTTLWKSLHEFERLGLVLEHLAGTGLFGAMETLTVRNWPRPRHDKHWPGLSTSDPLFVISARRLPAAGEK